MPPLPPPMVPLLGVLLLPPAVDVAPVAAVVMAASAATMQTSANSSVLTEQS
jgi:hypothetical protein